MILLIRDNECFEPRVQNYLHYFKNNNIDYRVIAWNRNGSAQEDDHIDFFQKRAAYGKRIKNIPNKLLWMLYVNKMIWKYRKNIEAIHACDIDAAIPAYFAGKCIHKIVLFDIFDWISSLTGKGMVYKAVEFMQNYIYKHADAIILCEEERKQQAKTTNEHVFVLPNIPDGMIQCDEDTMCRINEVKQNYRYVISYTGVFDRDRGLENLLKCVSKMPDLLLNIAGFGVLEDMIKDYADHCENICYFGRVDYSVAQAIMKCSDVMAAMYYLSSPLHRYAAPNKYYESLYLGVPIITTENTLVGHKTEKYDTGFVIDESISSLESLLKQLNLQMISEKKKNCSSTWDTVYIHYYNDFMESKYLRFINESERL